MDHILQRVVGSKRISPLDGFWGYNQVLVLPSDQHKTSFTTPWGTFMYVKMPFGLMNVGATFHRDMDIALRHRLFYNYLPWWYYCLLQNWWRTFGTFKECFWEMQKVWFVFKSQKDTLWPPRRKSSWSHNFWRGNQSRP